MPWAWFAPSYKVLGEAWRDTRKILAPVCSRVSEQEKRMEFMGGGVLEFWSLENKDAGRSRKYKGVIIDEAGLVPGLEEIWYNAIRPTLTDLKGEAWLLGTPKGRNFFWTAYTFGRDEFEPEWASWQMPTLTNPHIDPAEIEAARRQMPERSFQQEYEAIFLDESGGVFRNVRASVDKGRKDNELPSPSHAYRIGIDIARINDFTVIAVLDEKGRQVYFERFNQISWERIEASIVRVARMYGATTETYRPALSMCVMDSTGIGDPLYERLARQKIRVTPFTFTNASKGAAIDRLALEIEQGRIRLMDIETQTNELLAYQYELTASRNVRMNAPAGMHDDCVIALALAVSTPSRSPHLSPPPKPKPHPEDPFTDDSPDSEWLE